MESLESKLDRLSPEQRKEIEDFVDFLLSRSGQVCCAPGTSCNPLPLLSVAPPPPKAIGPAHGIENRAAVLQDPALTDVRADPVTRDEATSAPFLEIGGGIQDRITHDYMDYGQFDSSSSLATEAVKKIKRKIVAREGQDKPRHLLDWVD